MQSSSEGRLGLVHKTDYKWKGHSFSQISSVIQRNIAKPQENLSNRLLFRALPQKIYRKEIASINIPFKSTKQSIREIMDAPGGTIGKPADTTKCAGIQTSIDIIASDNKSCSSACNTSLTKDNPEQTNSSYVQSLSSQDNARRRVRSAGMNRAKFNNSKNGRLESYSTSSQYLYSRNKTFDQNRFSNLRIGDKSAKPGSASANENVYASNTIQHCVAGENSESVEGNTTSAYVPIYYKPNNSKFAEQGAVESSARLLRLKYDTITNSSNTLREAYGPQTANALAYGVPSNGYTIKDKVGYPNISTPCIAKVFT